VYIIVGMLQGQKEMRVTPNEHKNVLDKEQATYILSNLYRAIVCNEVDNIYLISYYSF
jgi:hypothetical protein